MADMYGAVRSNNFQVKDAMAFKKWFIESCYFGGEIELWEDERNTFAFGGYEQYPSAYPRKPLDEDSGEYPEWSLDAFGLEFGRHLAEGHKLVVVAAGNEKLRYVAAQRLEVHCTGWCNFQDWYAGN